MRPVRESRCRERLDNRAGQATLLPTAPQSLSPAKIMKFVLHHVTVDAGQRLDENAPL